MSLFAVFVFGSIGFWAAVLVLGAVMTFFSEEDGVKATITLILGALFLQFVAKLDLVGLIRGEPFKLALYGLVYVVLGFAFACIKWWRYAKKQRRQYDAIRGVFFKQYRIEGDSLPPELKSKFLEKLKNDYEPNKRGGFRHYSDSGDADPVIPDITKNKAAFIRWMTYWPLNALFTLLNDPVRCLFEWIYEVAGKKMQAVADHVFRGTERDRLSKEEKAELDRKKEEAEEADRQKRRGQYPDDDLPGGSGTRRRS